MTKLVRLKKLHQMAKIFSWVTKINNTKINNNKYNKYKLFLKLRMGQQT